MSQDHGALTKFMMHESHDPGRYPPVILASLCGLLAGGINGCLLMANWPQSIEQFTFERQAINDGFLHGLILAAFTAWAMDLARKNLRVLVPTAFVLGSIGGWLGVGGTYFWGSLQSNHTVPAWLSLRGFLAWGLAFGGPIAVCLALSLKGLKGIGALFVSPLLAVLGGLVFWGYIKSGKTWDFGYAPTVLVHGAVFGFFFAFGWIWGETNGLGMKRETSIIRRGKKGDSHRIPPSALPPA